MSVALPKSYEVIGSKEGAVAILEMQSELKGRKKEIADKILKRHKNVKTVLEKVSEREGKYRTRKFKVLRGSRDTEVIHKEHGCYFQVDPQKAYFSAREGTERLRIAKLVKPRETVMVMFAGIGAYPVIIAKQQPKADKIISIEINPKAVEYMEDNIRINSMQELIVPVLGDVGTKSKKWFGKCDRVVMPLPQDAWKYFGLALKLIKKKGHIHLYTISPENEIKADTEEKTRKQKKNIVNYSIKKVLPYSPRVNKYCIDMKVKI